MRFEKGHKYATGRPKGSKNVATIEREEAKRLYHDMVMGGWIDILRLHVEEAKKAKNYAERRDAIRNTIGDPDQKVEHSGEIKTGTPIPAEALAIIEEDLKKKKLAEQVED